MTNLFPSNYNEAHHKMLAQRIKIYEQGGSGTPNLGCDPGLEARDASVQNNIMLEQVLKNQEEILKRLDYVV